MFVKKAIHLLRNNKVIIYPTETVWGLGCDALSSSAVKAIFKIKKRSPQKLLSLLVRDIHMAYKYAFLPDQVLKVLNVFWPGPCSVLLYGKKSVPSWIHGKTKYINLRCSPHPFIKELFETFDRPLVSTSLNLSGEPPLILEKEITKVFPNLFFINNYESSLMSQKPSTIIKFEGEKIVCVRKGGVPLSDIEKVCQEK